MCAFKAYRACFRGGHDSHVVVISVSLDPGDCPIIQPSPPRGCPSVISVVSGIPLGTRLAPPWRLGWHNVLWLGHWYRRGLWCVMLFRSIECEQGVDEEREKCERDNGKELGRIILERELKCHNGTYESLPADVLHECIHNLGQQLSADPRSPDFRWVSIHTCFPLPARLEHVGYNIPFTEVVLVQHGTGFDLLDDVLGASQHNRCGHRRGQSYPWNAPIFSAAHPSGQ